MMQQFRSNSYLFGGNAPYVEELYEAYLDNPGSVPDNWRAYFDALQNVPAADGTDHRDVAHAPVVESFAQRAKANAFMVKTSSADLAVARKACEKFRVIPTSVISFMEGTRFTHAKHAAQKSPYQHLLKPKTGGIAMALQTLGDKFDCFLDVTIVYPKGVPEFHDLLLGRVEDVVVTVREVQIPRSLQMPDDPGSSAYRAELQAWMGELWARKDAEIKALTALHR